MPNPSQLPAQPVALQGVPAPGYSAQDLRRLALAGQAQEGAIAAGDFKVSQRAAGAGLGVDVAAGEALVQGDSVAAQGVYYQLLGAALTGATEVTVPAGDATFPTLHQLVLEIKDTAHDGSGLNVGRVRLVAGTPTSGATLDNRLGAATLPPNALLLADLLMPAASVTATNANIRDRRQWARGAYRRILRTQDAGGGNDYDLTSTSFANLDATNLTPRIECSGAPLQMRLMGRSSGAGATYLRPSIDGGAIDGGGDVADVRSGAGGFEFVYDFVPAAGSHLISWFWRLVAAGSNSFYARPDLHVVMAVEEIRRQNVSND